MAIKQGIIYCITNKVNKKQYVGTTTLPLNKVWKEHITNNTHKDLYNDINNLGTSRFNISVLEETTTDRLDERKDYYIDKLKSEYNNREVAEKIIIKNRDKTKEWVNNIKKSINKKVASGEKWGFMCEEHRGDGTHMKQKIEGTNIKTGEIKIWNSISDAALDVAGDKKRNGNIVLAARNGWEAYGYTWRKIGKNLHKRKIYGVHKSNGKKTQIYDSISNAERTINGKRGGGIRKSLLYPGKRTWKGYYWYYAD